MGWNHHQLGGAHPADLNIELRMLKHLLSHLFRTEWADKLWPGGHMQPLESLANFYINHFLEASKTHFVVTLV